MPPKCYAKGKALAMPPKWVYAKGKAPKKRVVPKPRESQAACIDDVLKNMDLSKVAGVTAADEQLT